QVARISEIDQRNFGSSLDRVVPSGKLDVEPIGEECLQAIEVALGLELLAIRGQPGNRAFGACGKCDQSFAQAVKLRKLDVRFLLERAVEVRGGDEFAEVRITLLVLRQQREPVDRGLTADLRRTCNGKHRADDRLHAFAEAS